MPDAITFTAVIGAAARAGGSWADIIENVVTLFWAETTKCDELIVINAYGETRYFADFVLFRIEDQILHRQDERYTGPDIWKVEPTE